MIEKKNSMTYHTPWRGDRVAEGARLESVCAVFRTEGSNPFLSASFPFSRSFCQNFQSYIRAPKPQYSWALASFSYATHAYLENRKITKNTPILLFYSRFLHYIRTSAVKALAYKALISHGFCNFGILSFIFEKWVAEYSE